MIKNNQDNEFDNNNRTNSDCITNIKHPLSDNEVANKKYVADSIGEGTLVRFFQTLSKYLEVSVGNDTYNLSKYDRIQIIDITSERTSNTGGYVLPLWKVYCNDKNGGGKKSTFIKATKSSSSTNHSGATSIPPVGNSFTFIETSSNNHGNNVYVSFEQAEIIQVSKIKFYYNRFSILTNNSLKHMGRFSIQLLLEGNS